jgi:hypothetical protein
MLLVDDVKGDLIMEKETTEEIILRYLYNVNLTGAEISKPFTQWVRVDDVIKRLEDITSSRNAYLIPVKVVDLIVELRGAEKSEIGKNP